MADATTIVKTNPTNVQWVHCGPPDPQVKELLASLSRKAKNSRIEWLKDMCMKSLPSGPYPFHVDGRGWFKGHIFDNQRYQVCYVIRKDLNLDVQVFESIRDRGDVVERRLVKDASTRIRIRVCKPELWAAYKELYPKEFTKIHAYWEFADVTVQSLLALIEVEGRLWKEYDAEANGSLELMKKVQAGPAQCEVICRGVAEDKVILEAMKKDAKASDEAFVSDLQKRALAVDKEIKKKEAKRPKLRRAKRCLPFTEKFGSEADEHAPYKRPKVRFVSKLDKAQAGLDAVNKQVGSTLWVVRKLEDEKTLGKIVLKKPKKIAAAIFKLLPREDLEIAAVKLAQNCAVDALEDVLKGYRRQALTAVRKKYNEHVRQSIVANNLLAQVQKEVNNDELGENAADAIPIMDDSDEEVVPVEQPGEGPDGPVGPEPKPKGEGPKSEGPDGPVGPEPKPKGDEAALDVGPQEALEVMATPGAVAREHWITSARSSTGYKGVSLEKKSGRFRIKHGGNTIARRETIEEACSFYYNWCVRNDIIKDFRLV